MILLIIAVAVWLLWAAFTFEGNKTSQDLKDIFLSNQNAYKTKFKPIFNIEEIKELAVYSLFAALIICGIMHIIANS